MVGLHSPFGTIGNIKREFGYTLDYVLWGESWINLLMQQSDAPRYTKSRQKRSISTASGASDLKKMLGR